MKTGKIGTIYKFISYIFFNIFILFIVLNLIAYSCYRVKSSWIKDYLKKYLKKEQTQSLLKSYEGAYTIDEIYQMIREEYAASTSRYRPWVLFSERPFNGKYINISKEGYRLNSNEQKEIDRKKLKIFAFGGSTMFGYGVADNQTIPAYLQKEIPDSCVINYGRANYYSTQEMVLFITLLKSGSIPDAVIFLDGLNEIQRYEAYAADNPAYSDILEKIFLRGYYINEDLIPLLRLSNDIRKRFKKIISRRKSGSSDSEDYVIEKSSEDILRYYRQNAELIKLIAAHYNIKVYFFWQPIPSYAFDLENHLFKTAEEGPDTYLHRLYNKVYNSMRNSLPQEVAWLVDIFKDKKYIYIDMHHYNPSGCKMIAKEMAKVIKADMHLK